MVNCVLKTIGSNGPMRFYCAVPAADFCFSLCLFCLNKLLLFPLIYSCKDRVIDLNYCALGIGGENRDGRAFCKSGRGICYSRPTYPPQLFQFIASKTPSHHLAWDVATGTGQAAKSLATLYENVIATDASEKQLEFAAKLPNI
ncbi:S-adenosylmethionine-dependent methyltransferase [Trifolium pratense]|uniref:S-adenosylmethionine-dependent methyltransferase n=1 Tax=Trifolium pratense TaxID=57577 RepID=A0A2K3LDV9_TRIPR|nr:S-adenosylmethionine-dependent methyltransferase [Trifolium pratense]